MIMVQSERNYDDDQGYSSDETIDGNDQGYFSNEAIHEEGQEQELEQDQVQEQTGKGSKFTKVTSPDKRLGPDPSVLFYNSPQI